MNIDKVTLYDGERFNFGTHYNDFLFKREKTDNSEVFLVVIEKGKSTHMHSHSECEQIFYIINGEGIIYTKDKNGNIIKSIEIQKNDVIHIPSSSWHQISNEREIELEYLCVNSFINGIPEAEPTSIIHAKNVIINNK